MRAGDAALQTPAVAVPSALAYVTVRAWGFPFALLNTAMWGICAGRNDPITPLLISLMSVVVNIAVRLLAVHEASCGFATPA
jgi:Na+-driven multidrug efflux pump